MHFPSLDLHSLQTFFGGSTGKVERFLTDLVERIDAYPHSAVWITRLSLENIIEQLHQSNRRRAGGIAQPLFGIPFAIKDNIDVAGHPTTAACPDFAYTPTKSATLVQRLIDAGAILIGKTNMDQFATGLVGTRSPYGPVPNAFNPDFISGGSSSGSAVAVAAGLVTFSLGTDTAGSGRVPASLNNIVGLKPTRGLISTTGVVPACKSLDCVSIFANGVGDATEILRITEGFDAEDIYSRHSVPRALPEAPFRFGILASEDREFFGDMDNGTLYENAVARLTALGGDAVEIDYTPFRAAGDLLYQGPWTVERLAAIRDFMARHEDAMDPTVRRIIAGARSLTAVDAFEGQYRLAGARPATDA